MLFNHPKIAELVSDCQVCVTLEPKLLPTALANALFGLYTLTVRHV